MMGELDPLKLDRDVARAARAERAWWRALRVDAELAAQDAWYEPARHVTTRTTFAAVSELSASDPLREPFLRWIHRLALTRIAARPIVDAARLRQQASIELEKPERGKTSARELVRRALADREPVRRRMWLDALGAVAPSILAAEKLVRESRIEITARLGVADASTFVPWDRETLWAEARRLLARTHDLSASLFSEREDVAGLLGDLVARDVPGSWPRAPSAAWLFDQFRGTPLVAGLALDMGPTPRSLGASSFARGLARFGAAYARVAVLQGGPFVLAADPSDAHPMRRGALFAALVLDPIFLRKKLGMSRDAAAQTARHVAKTALARARLDATRTLIDFALAGPSELEEAASDALKVRVPRELAGALPRPDARAPAALAGSLIATGDRDELRSRFDEDWFQNPRALSFLREVDASPRPFRLPKETLPGAADRLAQGLEEVAG
jgi:hypothetical protein